MLIPVRYNSSQKLGNKDTGPLKAGGTIIPGEFVLFVDGMCRRPSAATITGQQLFLAQKEIRVPEDADTSLDSLSSGDNMIVFEGAFGEFITDQIDRTNITSSTVYNAPLGVSATGVLTTVANAYDGVTGNARFREFISVSGGGAPKVRFVLTSGS
jgi:hypothetical protein